MTSFIRSNERQLDALRPVSIVRQYNKHAEGSVLVSFGDTQVICTASLESGVPPFLRGKGQGWITAEYGMLPRSTHERMGREAARGKQSGRTQEIQRLIGRALRAAVNLKTLGEYTLKIDCDVIQADGGTRTAAITGACVALADAVSYMRDKKLISDNPLSQLLASLSVGIYQGEAVLDLDYPEDSAADTDMNVIMGESGGFVEVQGTAERAAYTREELNRMLDLAERGIKQLIEIQKAALAE